MSPNFSTVKKHRYENNVYIIYIYNTAYNFELERKLKLLISLTVHYFQLEGIRSSEQWHRPVTYIMCPSQALLHKLSHLNLITALSILLLPLEANKHFPDHVPSKGRDSNLSSFYLLLYQAHLLNGTNAAELGPTETHNVKELYQFFS